MIINKIMIGTVLTPSIGAEAVLQHTPDREESVDGNKRANCISKMLASHDTATSVILSNIT